MSVDGVVFIEAFLFTKFDDSGNLRWWDPLFRRRRKMTIKSRVTDTIELGSTYDDWRSHTVEVNFAPKSTSASVAMSLLVCDSDDTYAAVGIKSFEYRDTPSGPNKKKNFGEYWPPSVYHELMTRVTFAVGVVYGSCWGGWTIDFWS